MPRQSAQSIIERTNNPARLAPSSDFKHIGSMGVCGMTALVIFRLPEYSVSATMSLIRAALTRNSLALHEIVAILAPRVRGIVFPSDIEGRGLAEALMLSAASIGRIINVAIDKKIANSDKNIIILTKAIIRHINGLPPAGQKKYHKYYWYSDDFYERALRLSFVREVRCDKSEVRADRLANEGK